MTALRGVCDYFFVFSIFFIILYTRGSLVDPIKNELLTP